MTEAIEEFGNIFLHEFASVSTATRIDDFEVIEDVDVSDGNEDVDDDNDDFDNDDDLDVNEPVGVNDVDD